MDLDKPGVRSYFGTSELCDLNQILYHYKPQFPHWVPRMVRTEWADNKQMESGQYREAMWFSAVLDSTVLNCKVLDGLHSEGGGQGWSVLAW